MFRKKILFIIRDLNYGGAQRQLVTLVKGMDKEKFDISVLHFYSGGKLKADLENSGVKVISLDKSGRWDILKFARNIKNHFDRIRPDIVHGYLGESNLVASILGFISPQTKVIWGVRDSIADEKTFDWLGVLLFKIECFISKFVDLIIVNSHTGKQFYSQKGYPSLKMVVIPNGIDVKRFQPDSQSGEKVRTKWGIDKNAIAIGLVGRVAPMKDYPNFMRAMSILSGEYENLHFVCVGVGPEEYTLQMKQLAQEIGISERITWGGGRSDMNAVYNAFDILVSSSAYGEGFANVVGEAMSCGIPCVVTDVGDSAFIVGDNGKVVPKEEPLALASGCRELIELSREEKQTLKVKSRERIVNNFRVQNLVQNTQSYLLKL